MTLYQQKYRIESARRPGWDYGARGWYLVTICTQNRACIFGKVVNGELELSRIGAIADAGLRTLASHYQHIQVDEHIVMPNHVHAIVVIDGEHCFTPGGSARFPLRRVAEPGPPRAGSLAAIVRSYKSGVTRMCGEMRVGGAIWQARFHDRLLRGEKVISAVREYVQNNPANWGVDRENPFRPQGCGGGECWED